MIKIEEVLEQTEKGDFYLFTKKDVKVIISKSFVIYQDNTDDYKVKNREEYKLTYYKKEKELKSTFGDIDYIINILNKC